MTVTPVFRANQSAYETGQFRVIANQGSTRSSKTYSICQFLTILAATTTKAITVVSPSLPHLKRGAMRDWREIMEAEGLYKESDHNKTDQVYKFPSGGYIEFFGCEDVGKVRGPGRDILFVNEANLIHYDAYLQLALRTKETIFIDFNPADEYSWVYDVADKEGNKLIVSTYQNNLANIPASQVEEIEALKEADENLWKVYGLGQRGTSSETIYTHWKECDSFPQCDEVVFGLDFGFTHPTGLVKVGFLDGKVYWDEQLYESKLTNDDLAFLMKSQFGLTRSTEIFAETARPEAIEEIRRAGLNIKPADKAVLEGIKMVKSKPLFITRRSTNLIKEIKSYKWKKDKDGRVLDEPVKFNDDLLDAARYATYTYLFKPKRTFADASY